MFPRLVVVPAMVVLAGAVQAAVLFAIATHPAGSGDASGEAFAYLLLWASFPLVGCMAAAVLLRRLGRTVPVRGFSVALLAGTLVAALGSVQFSHATPGFLLLAFVVQCWLIVLSVRRSWRHAI